MIGQPLPLPPAIAAVAPDGRLTPALRRRIMIDMARRRIQPGAGSAPEFLRRRTAMNPWPDLRPGLAGIPWVVVGGVATRAYMPERATKDLDILVRDQDGGEVQARLLAAGYKIISRLATRGFLAAASDGAEVDVILGSYPWLGEALAHIQKDLAGYPVLDLPYLVITKLAASHIQDVGDLSRMLGLASDAELARVRQAVTRYAPDDLADLESLIYLGRFEMQSEA
jgi:hypothetical protein